MSSYDDYGHNRKSESRANCRVHAIKQSLVVIAFLGIAWK